MYRTNLNPPMIPYAPKRMPYIMQKYSKDHSPEEDLSISLITKPKQTHGFHQPTYYGNWGGTFCKDVVSVHGTAMSGGSRVRTDCTHQMALKVPINPYGLKTAERFFPSSILRTSDNRRTQKRDKNFRAIQNCYGEITHISRKGCSSEVGAYECRKTLYNFPKELPQQDNLAENSFKVGRSYRPMSGGIIRRKYINDVTNDETENIEKYNIKPSAERAPRNRLSTAQAPRLPMGPKPPPYRVSTPQTAPERRPDSRYNKESLFAGLENGRRSPEYQVPIIDMKLEECACHDSIMPDCWKK